MEEPYNQSKSTQYTKDPVTQKPGKSVHMNHFIIDIYSRRAFFFFLIVLTENTQKKETISVLVVI